MTPRESLRRLQREWMSPVHTWYRGPGRAPVATSVSQTCVLGTVPSKTLHRCGRRRYELHLHTLTYGRERARRTQQAAVCGGWVLKAPICEIRSAAPTPDRSRQIGGVDFESCSRLTVLGFAGVGPYPSVSPNTHVPRRGRDLYPPRWRMVFSQAVSALQL